MEEIFLLKEVNHSFCWKLKTIIYFSSNSLEDICIEQLKKSEKNFLNVNPLKKFKLHTENNCDTVFMQVLFEKCFQRMFWNLEWKEVMFNKNNERLMNYQPTFFIFVKL